MGGKSAFLPATWPSLFPLQPNAPHPPPPSYKPNKTLVNSTLGWLLTPHCHPSKTWPHGPTFAAVRSHFAAFQRRLANLRMWVYLSSKDPRAFASELALEDATMDFVDTCRLGEYSSTGGPNVMADWARMLNTENAMARVRLRTAAWCYDPSTSLYMLHVAGGKWAHRVPRCDRCKKSDLGDKCD